MDKPFEDESENKKYENLQKSIITKLNKMILANDPEVLKYYEMICSSLLLEINKKFPEPNYSIYLTSRIKSSKSNIAKLEDYTKRLKEDGEKINLKSVLDEFGLRIIVEKIPHNITLDPQNSEYETLKALDDERKENVKISDKFHKFESKIDDNNCTYYEYYSQSKELVQHILNLFESESKYSKDYALDLKEKYNNILNECNKKIAILDALGDYSKKLSTDSIDKISSPDMVDFKALLNDFDSRIDSKLGLKLYSNALPNIIENSKQLQELGISMNLDPHANKIKREKSGYVADFYGLYSNVIDLPIELQIMYANEHQQSINGYSAHSKMPGKEATFMKVPNAYVAENMKLLSTMGKKDVISNDELSLFNDICEMRRKNKTFDKKYTKLLRYLTRPENVVLENNSPVGIKLDDNYKNSFKAFCSLTKKENTDLKSLLYDKGCKIYNAWAENISAKHATARLDTDSSAKNRVKIHYDDPYECLAHSIREQLENPNPEYIDSEYYLNNIYLNRNDLLGKHRKTSSESSIIDFEIKEYINTELPKLKQDIKSFEEKNSMEIDDIEK